MLGKSILVQGVLSKVTEPDLLPLDDDKSGYDNGLHPAELPALIPDVSALQAVPESVHYL